MLPVIEQSKVVLTCRLNVWDVNLNGLSNFETFRMGKFSQDDVDEFISEWFIKVERPESAPILQAKLKEPNRDRIRDTVRHPLRLALLCQTFYLNPNTDLPETKAGLYDRFVPCFYEWNEWKPNIVDEHLLAQDTLRNELHLALGKLAITGIDSDAGFRLSRSLAVKEMGDRLFGLACDVGWLTLEQDQKVYAFYHASFQEYFAALAISHWKFFLPDSLDDFKSNDYPIFDMRWREVILFWFGQKGLEKDKENFIEALINFEDGCCDSSIVNGKSFYGYRSYFLAASCLSEFKYSSENEVIIEQITRWAFGYWDTESQNLIAFLDPIMEETRNTLPHTNLCLVAKYLCQILNNPRDEKSRLYLVAKSLAKIAIDSESKDIAVNTLIDLIEDSTTDKETRCQALFSLDGFVANSRNKALAIEALVRVINDSSENEVLSSAAYSLGKIATDSKIKDIGVSTLSNLIKNSTDGNLICPTAYSLWEVTKRVFEKF